MARPRERTELYCEDGTKKAVCVTEFAFKHGVNPSRFYRPTGQEIEGKRWRAFELPIDWPKPIPKQERYDDAFIHKKLMKMLNRTRSRARERRIEFDIKYNDLLDVYPKDLICPVFGTKMKFGHTPGGQGSSPSIDRIDNAKGYVKGNIHIISSRANMMKHDASPKELLRFAEWICVNKLIRSAV